MLLLVSLIAIFGFTWVDSKKITIFGSTKVDAKKPKWNELNGYTFKQYVFDFKKHYHPQTETWKARSKIFAINLRKIKSLNRRRNMLWKAGVNSFTDLSEAEFKKTQTGLIVNEELRKKPTNVHPKATGNESLPIQIDLRTATSPRVLTSVKHQGSCGSCWAHSAAESIESQFALKTGKLAVLSPAQINSCTPAAAPYGAMGCRGGDYVSGWQFLIDSASKNSSVPEVLKSLTENWAYGFPIKDWFFSDQPQGYNTSACLDVSKEWNEHTKPWSAELTAAGVSGFTMVDSNSPSGGPAAMKALRDVGPLSVSVASGNWQWYESGIMHNTNSSGYQAEWGIDHAVQMVGYGYDKDLNSNYFLVRNTWSTLWGEDGFIRLFRAKEGDAEPCSPSSYGRVVCGTSGVLNYPAYPIVYEASPTHFG